jgi:hypothetical protein
MMNDQSRNQREKMRNTIIIVISALAGVLLLTTVQRGNARPDSQPTQQTSSRQTLTPQTGTTKNPSHQHQGDNKSGDSGMQGMPDMPGMDMGNSEKAPDNHAESGAMRSMQPGHHMMDGAHMHMTPMRPATAEDVARADQIAAALRDSIEKYKDYRLALADGYKIFLPNLPQAQYHFTNYWNGFLEGFTFDPARPTSLLYKKTRDGYELVGAMYTAPKSATLDQLNERVPLGVASWHVHINFCMPKREEAAHADWTKFGLTGSISTAEACSQAGGKFYPQIFGWMVHVYPFESSRAKVWGQ